LEPRKDQIVVTAWEMKNGNRKFIEPLEKRKTEEGKGDGKRGLNRHVGGGAPGLEKVDLINLERNEKEELRDFTAGREKKWD